MFPQGVLIASIMEEYSKDAWIEIVERCQDAGRRCLRVELLLPARLARAEDGRGEWDRIR
jgi:dihydropyrimidine dehydrogenase (NADP+)/dihydropyrimidine dehydrogenase (NAD+) subunit PreA